MRAGWVVATLGLLLPTLHTVHAGGGSPTVDPAARLPEGDSAREYWDLAAQFDSGHRFYARFLITNEGPGNRSAVATGDLVDPEGHAVPFQNGRRKGRWTLGEDARSLRIGSSRLDLSGIAPRVEIDNEKRAFRVVLEFEADTTAAVVFDAEGYRLDLLQLASPVSGHVQHAEMPAPLEVSGRATLTHGWTSRAEADALPLRADLASLSPGPAVFLSFWLSPEAPTRAWLGVRTADGGTRVVEPERVQVDFPQGQDSEYPLPSALRFDGHGLRVTASPRGPTLTRNPLDSLPMAIRMLYSFGAQPIRVWSDATFRVEMEPRAEAESASWGTSGIATLNFQDAFPTPVPDS